MTFKTDDRVFETSITTGTGTYSLDGAQVGFTTFAGMGNGNTCAYFATDDTNWEVGIGTIMTGPARLARTAIMRSSNADAAVDWGAGTRNIRCAFPAVMAQPHPACDGRLTLATGTPVTTTDQTAKTTLYFTPYGGGLIGLYNGAAWLNRPLSEISIAVPATTNQMYDVFCYDNAGTPTLELLAWTNDTTRATALTTQDGVLVKTGAVTRRYLGSFRTTGSSGQTEDSLAKRYVWNYYNRVARPMSVLEATASWTYTTNTVRQANAAGGNQLDFVLGVAEDTVRATVSASARSAASTVDVNVGIGLDSTSSISAVCLVVEATTPGGGIRVSLHAHFEGFPGVGRHYLAWLERSDATGTTTWWGVSAANLQSGIVGGVWG